MNKKIKKKQRDQTQEPKNSPSMFTAITGTRALVNLIYGGRSIKRISIGI